MIHSVNNLPSVISTFEPFVRQYGYYGLFGILLIENAGIPFPGETVMVAASVYAGYGVLHIEPIVILSVIASFFGYVISYSIGRIYGNKLKTRFKMLNKLKNYKSGLSLILSRFIEGYRQLNGYITGIANLRLRMFLIYNLIGATLWVLLWSLIGYYSANYIAELFRLQTYATIVLIIVVAIVLTRYILKYRKRS